ncbi:flavin-containing monooxygenase 5-like [Glandiceps talaboti]
MPKRVAIIGAGSSGLGAIKCCLDEGLEPVCFEKGTDIGGLWNYHTDIKEGHASVFRSTIINTSKEIMCFSDFPAPKEYPNFMHNTWVVKYFRLFANHFGLLQYIHFNMVTESVQPASDYATSGKWDVKYTDTEKNDTKTETFDAVLVCSGHHVDPHKPTFPGQDEFQGRIVHTHDYKVPKGYENKRILVIGIGNSGGDAAVELARVGSQVFLSTRRGSWILNRVSDEGYPIDLVIIRRFLKMLPASIRLKQTIKKLNHRFNHANYGLQPDFPPSAQHPMVNDLLPNEILSGRVKIKANVKLFMKSSVEFEDGTVEEDIDEVIMATGYIFGFPFLDESVVKVTNNEVSVYKYVFPPSLKHGTLAIIGLIQPLGAINAISEMQCRWATRVFKGLANLPSKEVMIGDIQAKKEAMATRYVKSQRHTIQVDYIPYMDELANQIGVRPNFQQMIFSDPKLAWKCVLGPFTPYQYRLVGPGKWNGAKEAIETIWERVIYATKTRPVKEAKKGSGFGDGLKIFIFIAVVMAFVMKYYK